jgi:hypothetical protein
MISPRNTIIILLYAQTFNVVGANQDYKGTPLWPSGMDIAHILIQP